MKPMNALIGFAEGFIQDAKPFLDLVKALGYFTENMELTESGKQVLKEYYEKKYGDGSTKTHQG